MHRTHAFRAGLALAACFALPSATAAAAAPVAPPADPGVTLLVAPGGSDAATSPGTADRPLATLTEALRRSTNGQTIRLAPGNYPAATDKVRRVADVSVVGAPGGSSKVAGFTSGGAMGLDISGISFTGRVILQGNAVTHAANPSQDVTLHDNDFSGAGYLTIKEGARNITVRNNHFHDAPMGINGPGNPYVSRGIAITGNVIERIVGDGIQFGAWSDVSISGNVIQNIADPAKSIHNDAIQFTGNSSNVSIVGNQLLSSRTQLLFIQNALGPIDGVVVQGNVIAGAGGVAVQSLGATNVAFRHNTIWNGNAGGLWIGKGGSTLPTGTSLVSNLISNVRVVAPAPAPAVSGNVVTCPPRGPVADGTPCVSDPAFNPDWTLAPGSPVRPLAAQGDGTPAGAFG